MPEFRDFMNPEAPGSRFASRPGLAILSGSRRRDRYDAPDSDTGNAAEVVGDAFGQEPAELSALGRPSVIDASYGRGASAWTPAVEWLLDAAGTGIIGTAAFAAVREATRQFREVLDRLRQRDVEFLVNRGGAALVALAYAIDALPETNFEVEAVEEFSWIAGRESSETNPVGAEPWLVCLVDLDRTVRIVVAVNPDGSNIGDMRLPIGQLERGYMPPPGRTGSASA